MTCEACGQDRLVSAGEAADGELLRCRGCGSWRLLSRCGGNPDRDAGYGDAYRSGFGDEKTRRCLAIFRESVPPRDAGRLLDVGCSEGAFLRLARGEGWDVRGLDPDPVAVAAARREGIEVVSGCAGEAVSFGGAFDAVTLWDVVEHLAHPDEVAAWLSGIVRDGGHLVVLTPDATSVFDRLAHLERGLTRGRSQRLTTLCLNRYHLHRFTPRGLRLLFERHGFRVDVLERTQVFSLRPERYLSGFAPGIQGWTPSTGLNRVLSRVLFALVRVLGIRNKLLLVARREPGKPRVSPRAEGGAKDRWNDRSRVPRIALVRIPVSRFRLYRWYWLMASRQPPLGLLYIASHLRRNGVETVLLDGEKLGHAALRSRLASFCPDILGVTVTTFSFWDVAAFVEEMRSRFPDALLLVGGPHSTSLPTETLAQIPAADGAVVGEGEEVVLRIAAGDPPGEIPGLAWRDAAGDFHRTETAPFLENLDEYQLQWEMLDGFPHAYQPNLQSRKAGGTVALVASRGCMYRCVYCASGNLYGNKHRAHSPEFVADAMTHLEERYGVRDFYFHDDYFTMRMEWLEEFCRVLVSRGSPFTWSCASRIEKLDDALLERMRRAGCYQIGVGVESGSAKMLRVMRKGTTPERLEEGLKRIVAAGIDVKAYVIIGTAEESLQDLLQTIRLLLRARVRHVQVLYFTPLPGSPSYHQYPADPSAWPRMNLLNRMEGAALPAWALWGVELATYCTVYGSALLRPVFARSPAGTPGVAPSA